MIEDCPSCGGDGYIIKYDYFGNIIEEVVCDRCDGLGTILLENEE